MKQYLRVYNSLRAQTAAVREFEEKKAADKEALAVEGASANCGDGKFELNSKLLDQVKVNSMISPSFTDCNIVQSVKPDQNPLDHRF